MADENERGIGAALAKLLQAHAADREAIAAQRRLLVSMSEAQEHYFRIGAKVYQALQEVTPEILPPSGIDAVITPETMARSAPGHYIFAVDVAGNVAAASHKFRRELAKLLGVSLQELLQGVNIQIVGNNVVISRK